MAYYGADVVDVNGNRIDDIRPKELITEAVQKANPDVNYAEYDYDNDGYVDGVHVIFAGYDQSANVSALPDAIWSHKWQIPKIKFISKSIGIISIVDKNELWGIKDDTKRDIDVSKIKLKTIDC